MGRFLAGVASALLLMGAGIVIWRSQADAVAVVPPPPGLAPAALGIADLAPPPEASERTREQKRFDRYDKDRNGAVTAAEYLANRRKAYDRLDTNRDGQLSFSEYGAKAVLKFAGADRDKSGVLNASEFLTTRVVRQDSRRANCPPPLQARQAPPPEGDGEEG